METYCYILTCCPYCCALSSVWLCKMDRCWRLTLSTLGKIFSRWHIEIFFLIFLENRVLQFMQIVSKGDTLREMPYPFFWEKKKNIINLSSAELAQKMIKVKGNRYTFKGGGNCQNCFGSILKRFHSKRKELAPPFKSHFANCLAVCKNKFEKFARIFSRQHIQTTFSDAGFLGILSVSSWLMGIMERESTLYSKSFSVVSRGRPF